MKERISFMEVSPKLLEGINKTEGYIKSSGFDLKLLELIKYRVSQINGCAFCLDMHHKEAIHMGESQLRLHSLAAWRECHFYSDPEKAALAFAEALTHVNQGGVNDEVFDNLKNFYSGEEIALLTVVVTQINTWNRINAAFRTTPGEYKLGQFG